MSVENYLKASKRDIFQWQCDETTDGYGMSGVQSESVHVEGYNVAGSVTKEGDDEFEVDVILNHPIFYDGQDTYEVIDYRSNRKLARLLAERLIKDDLRKEIKLSDEQLEEMRHSLGLNYKKKPYRNRFFTHCDDEKWNDLVSKKLALKGKVATNNKDSDCCFWLTKFGAEYAYGKNMSDKFYNEL